VWEDDLKEAGRAPTLGRVQIGLNMIHGPMGQNKVSQHRLVEKVSALKVHTGSGRPSQGAAILESECRPRESNSISFLSVVPKQ
jgi:hypothetical protein